MENGRMMLSKEEVDDLLKPGDHVHTFIQVEAPGTVLIGADIKRSKLLEITERYGTELAGVRRLPAWVTG